jgi:hypothetical protein
VTAAIGRRSASKRYAETVLLWAEASWNANLDSMMASMATLAE